MWQAGLPILASPSFSWKNEVVAGTSVGEAGAPSLATGQFQRATLPNLNLNAGSPLAETHWRLVSAGCPTDGALWAPSYVVLKAPPGRFPPDRFSCDTIGPSDLGRNKEDVRRYCDVCTIHRTFPHECTRRS